MMSHSEWLIILTLKSSDYYKISQLKHEIIEKSIYTSVCWNECFKSKLLHKLIYVKHFPGILRVSELSVINSTWDLTQNFQLL